MAEAILKNKLKKKKITNVNVKSCGVKAVCGMPADSRTIDVCTENNIPIKRFKTTAYSSELAQWADVIICMTADIRKATNSEKATDFTLLYGLPPVIDPFGGDIEDYRKTFYDLNFACELLAKDINLQSKNK